MAARNAGSVTINLQISPQGKTLWIALFPCGCVLRYWLTRLPCKIPTQFNDSTRIPLGHGPLPTTVANENLWESPNPYKKCHHSGGHCCTQDSTDSIGSPFVLRHLRPYVFFPLQATELEEVCEGWKEECPQSLSTFCSSEMIFVDFKYC